MAQKTLKSRSPKSSSSSVVKRKGVPTKQLSRFKRDPKGTKVLHQSIEEKAAAKAMKNEGARFRLGDLNSKAKQRLDLEESEEARKKEKRRTAVDGAVASLEHAVEGKRLKV
jgi:hypothetical protein